RARLLRGRGGLLLARAGERKRDQHNGGREQRDRCPPHLFSPLGRRRDRPWRPPRARCIVPRYIVKRHPRAGRSRKSLTEGDYRALARWRYALRRFLRFSETAARRTGISPNQYQLL